jgi:hypothetical protein
MPLVREHHKRKAAKHFFDFILDMRKLIIVYVASLILATILFAVFDYKSFWDSFYWACITSVAVGYGDDVPTSDAGRALTIIFSHFWIYFINPVIIGNVAVRIFRNPHEFTQQEQDWMMSMLAKIGRKEHVRVPPKPSPTA